MAGLGSVTSSGSQEQRETEMLPPPNATGTLEVSLAQASSEHAPLTCRLCGPEAQVVLDNPKELCIHMELVDLRYLFSISVFSV